MPRTPAQLEAVRRDLRLFGVIYCLYHKARSDDRALVLATDYHHLARRQPGGDVADLIYPLCRACHTAHDNGRSPTTSELLDCVQLDYGLDLRAAYPRFFAGR